MDLHALLGLSVTEPAFAKAFSPLISRADASLRSLSPQTVPEPSTIKSYTDTVYLNYQTWGFSIQLEQPKSQPNEHKSSSSRIRELKDNADAVPPAKWMEKLGDPQGYKVSAIDVYNSPDNSTQKSNTKSSSRKYNVADWGPFPAYPLAIRKLDETNLENIIIIQIDNTWSGKDLVQSMGEPDRKGGGQGAKQGGIGIWVEWSDMGVMAEWSDAQGPKAWDEGASNAWKVLTVFARQTTSGDDDN